MNSAYKVLLINPPLEHILKMEMSEDVIEEMGHYPPLGLLYLATYLKEKSREPVEVRVVDCVPEHVGYNGLENIFREWKPDMVCVTTFTPTLVDIVQTAKLAKKADPAIKVALGGHHVDSYPRESLAINEVDYICRGEGEQSLLALIDAVRHEREPSSIAGVGYKKGADLIMDERVPFIRDLDSVPIPDRDLIKNDLYTCTLGAETVVATVMSSRGCPYTCTFCYCPTKNYRMRGIASIIGELKDISRRGIKEVFFFDDLFNVSAKRVIEISAAMLDAGLKMKWSFRGRVNNITKEMLATAKRAGCERIHFGIETSSDARLKVINKKTDIAMIDMAVRLTRESGIVTVGSFMIGLPGETKEEIFETFRFMRRLRLDYAQVSVLMPYPNTELYVGGLRRGVIREDYWRKFAADPLGIYENFKPQVWTEMLSQEELFRLVNVGYREFYMRPSYIMRSLFATRSVKELASKMHAGTTLLKEVFFPPRKISRGR